MNAQLLLLLALAGPFCAFTRASPTIIPTDTVSLVNSTEEPYKGYAVITSPYPKTNTNLPMVPEEVPLEMTTAAATAEVHLEMTTAAATAEVSLEMTTAAATDEVSLEMTTAAASKLPLEVATDATKEVAQNDTLVTSQQTERPKSWQPLNTQAAAAKTEAPTKEAEVVQTSGTAAATTESDDLLEGLTSGHAAGIVIGALLAVAIVIAVAIIVARRMGKYSP